MQGFFFWQRHFGILWRHQAEEQRRRCYQPERREFWDDDNVRSPFCDFFCVGPLTGVGRGLYGLDWSHPTAGDPGDRRI
jgi:hypothetical protein